MKKLLFLCTLAGMTVQSYSQVDLDAGLKVYLPFNGDTEDASGNGNDATDYGATLTADQAGNPNSAYYFDGENDYMKIPLVSMFASLPDSLTFAVKVKPHAFYDGICHGNMIINTGISDSDPSTYTLHYTSNSYYPDDCYTYDTIHQNYRYGYGGTPYDPAEMSNEPFIKADSWDCVVYTYDGSIHKMYVNGELRYEIENTLTTPGAITNDIWLGAKDSETWPYWMNATLDEVRIYNRPLNEDEIKAYCTKGGQPSGLSNIKTGKLPVVKNPVTDVLSLSLQNTDLGGNFKVIDLSGRVMINVASLTTTSIPVDRLVPGMYIVNYQVKDKFLRTKIIKE